MSLKTDGMKARAQETAPLGDVAFWLEETLALAEKIAAELPRLWQYEPPQAEQAAAALFTAEVEPDELPDMITEMPAPAAAANGQKQQRPERAAAGERADRRPEVNPGVSHIVRRKRDRPEAPEKGGRRQRLGTAGPEQTAAAAEPELLTEWLVEGPLAAALSAAEPLLPPVQPEDILPEEDEAALPRQFGRLTPAAEPGLREDNSAEWADWLPGVVWAGTAAESEPAAEDSPVIRTAAGGKESLALRYAEPLPALPQSAPVDMDELAEAVAGRLQERLEVILQSRPFVG